MNTMTLSEQVALTRRPKLCTECRDCVPQQFGWPTCKSPMARPTINPVDGSIEPVFCNVMRLDGEPCGTSARLFVLAQTVSEDAA